jgi:hypothetical protein
MQECIKFSRLKGAKNRILPFSRSLSRVVRNENKIYDAKAKCEMWDGRDGSEEANVNKKNHTEFQHFCDSAKII